MSIFFDLETGREHVDLLLNHGLIYCDKCSFILRSDQDMSSELKSFMASIQPFLISSNDTSEWPGTRTLDIVQIYYCKYIKQLIPVFKEILQAGYNWWESDLPEDLCLYRTDGTVWLGSTVHEGYGWLNLNTKELETLKYSYPEIYDMLEKPSAIDIRE